MKHLLLPLLVLLMGLVASAQSASETIRRNPEAAAGNEATPATRKLKKATDRRHRLHDRRHAIADSLETHVSNRKHTVADSLKAYLVKQEAARTRVIQKMDSVERLGSLDKQRVRVLDSLRQLQSRLMKKTEKARSRLTRAEAKAAAIVAAPQNKVTEKLGLLANQANGQGNLPANIALPGAGQHPLHGRLSAKVPVRSALPASNNPLGKRVQQAKGALNGIQVTTPRQLNALGAKNDLFKLRREVNSITRLMSTTARYRQAVQQAGVGSIPDGRRLEGMIATKSPLQEVQVISRQQKQLEEELKAKADSAGALDAYRKQTLAKAKEVAFKQIATQQAKIKETMGKISVYQRQNRTVFNKVKGLPKGKPEKENKLPLLERLVPGVTLQVQRPGVYLLDLTPTLRYRITSILSVGAGWNERFAITDKRKLVSGYQLYGVRGFTELTFTKGFSLRLDVERMNAFVPFNRHQYDVGQRRWVWNYMGGLKKEFSFMRGITGNVQFMYNLYDPKRTSPYLDRYNVRFGFEFPFNQKKDQKPE